MKRYFFRVDGGSIYSIATGHITRCLKLADYIKKSEDAQISFIMKDFKEGVRIVEGKYKVFLLAADISLGTEIDSLRAIISKDSFFICDIRNVDDEYIAGIRKNCLRFILFDDLGIKNISPDILINPTPFCDMDYRPEDFSSRTLSLLGEKFFFINEAIMQNSYIRDFGKGSFNIMASFGGADPCNITEFFLRKIVPKIAMHNISIILGPAFGKKNNLIEKYRKINNVRFFSGIWPLDQVFLDNDIAFVCGGDTCIESCASGAATFIISSIDYEKRIGELLSKKGMGCFVTDIQDIQRHKFTQDAYLDVLDDPKQLTTLSHAARQIIDGKGLERVYQAMVNFETS